MLRNRETLADLQRSFTQTGNIKWIGVRPAARAPIVAVEQCELLEDRGIAGDRAALRSGGKRQVTLVQFEHLAVVKSLMGLDTVDPEKLRRNFLVSGINLLALRTARFLVGTALLEGTGYCHPCSRMEEALGKGGYTALRGHGGITARVLRGGLVAAGDKVVFDELVPPSSRP